MATHRVTRDGVEKFQGSEDECFVFIHRAQGQSVDWACKWEGWDITSMDGAESFRAKAREIEKRYGKVGRR